MAQVRGQIEAVKMAEGGLLLEVFVPWPATPQPPEDLVKAPEDVKNEYHHRTVAFCAAHREVERIRTGAVILEQPDTTRAERRLEYEEKSWEAYQASLIDTEEPEDTAIKTRAEADAGSLKESIMRGFNGRKVLDDVGLGHLAERSP